jgi:prevent-host-death family protein
MSDISIRDLRNHGGEVIERALRGERLTITKAGKPVAQLVPLPRPPASLDALRRRWARLPRVDPVTLRHEIDAVVDPDL